MSFAEYQSELLIYVTNTKTTLLKSQIGRSVHRSIAIQ